jgi:glycosyltransferase involved in cell wall biosynthesis
MATLRWIDQTSGRPADKTDGACMSQPALRIVGSLLKPVRPRAGSIVLIGNYPPRRCGIATFTADVHRALREARPEARCEVYALTDVEGAYAYPPEVACEIRQDEIGDYLAAADRLSTTQPDLICVQHEFGIFGGPAGEHLLTLLEATDRPVVTTLHTVLETPDEDQRRVFSRLLARSSRLVVMAERGREILRRVWTVADDKILVIPHGAPDRPLSATGPFKDAVGCAGREFLFTFGLLSPGKGIEAVIKALPRIVAERPKATYTMLGATHPHLIAREGERYRQSLMALAQDLGVEDHLRLVDEYTDEARLVEYLQAADVYITPYLNAQQVTSGTLAYAAALGRPIVSTPYWHAEELLADGRGRLTPFGSSEAIADAVIDLLTHDDVREALSRRIYDAARGTIWIRFAARMLEACDEAMAQPARRLDPAVRRPVPGRAPIAPSLGGVRRMTDGCGILQHSLFSLPDRRHGYCVDDNARALILMHRMPGPPDAERSALTSVYAAFVAHAWNEDEKRFRNFMSYERAWLEARGSEDSIGRSIWAVATTAATAVDPGHRRWAASLMDRILEAGAGIASPRADAFIVLGLCAMLEAGADDKGRARELAQAKAGRLAAMLRPRTARNLPWFEDYLSYDNARLPEALIRAGVALERPAMVAQGVAALDWLCRRQTDPTGHFLPVATVDFGRPLDAGNLFDQQPVEAAATIDACEAAWKATGDSRWIEEADRAYAWFFGANTLGAALATADGDCFDGLTWAGPNENQGAESVLSLQLATCAMRRLTGTTASSLKTAIDA